MSLLNTLAAEYMNIYWVWFSRETSPASRAHTNHESQKKISHLTHRPSTFFYTFDSTSFTFRVLYNRALYQHYHQRKMAADRLVMLTLALFKQTSQTI